MQRPPGQRRRAGPKVVGWCHQISSGHKAAAKPAGARKGAKKKSGGATKKSAGGKKKSAGGKKKAGARKASGKGAKKRSRKAGRGKK